MISIKETICSIKARFIEKVSRNKKYRQMVIAFAGLLLAALSVCIFAVKNESFYNKPIAKIIAIEEIKSEKTDVFGNREQVYAQKVQAIVMNGEYKGEEITFDHAASSSQALDILFEVGDEVFVSIDADVNGKILSVSANDLKRDQSIVFAAVLFGLLLLFIGKSKGVLSLLSLLFNGILIFILIDLYSNKVNLILLSVFVTAAFVVLTILFVNGINQNSASAILSTFIAIACTMALTIAVMSLTKSQKIFYEEMEFITANPEKIFLAQILIGNLGGTMDIAVSLSAAIKEMYARNPNIEKAALIQSAKNIGSDIMGTMANTMVFACLSGSIPMVLLLIKNGYSPFYILQNNISLEVIRALVGGIGMVLSIPISWRFAVFFLKNKRGGAA